MSTRRSADRPSRRKRRSSRECCASGPSSAFPSRNTVTASSKETPCLAALTSAFRGSHSNTYLVYTKCWMRQGSGVAFPAPPKMGAENSGGAGNRESAQAATGTGSWHSLRLHNVSKNQVDLGVRQRNREDSVTTPKVARISRLRQKRASRESFSNCRYEVATPGASTIYSSGFAPRTPLHALSLAASPARSDRVARSRRSLATAGHIDSTGFASRTSFHALSLAASPARSDHVARSGAHSQPQGTLIHPLRPSPLVRRPSVQREHV